MSLTPEQMKKFVETIGAHLPLDYEDDSLIVLKAHLICEELINSYISHFIAYPKYILGPGVRSYMHEKIKISRAISNEVIHDRWIWKGLKNLNNLRNAYAHSLIPDIENLNKAKKTFITHVKSNEYHEFKTPELGEFRNSIMSLLMAVFVVVEISTNEKTI